MLKREKAFQPERDVAMWDIERERERERERKRLWAMFDSKENIFTFCHVGTSLVLVQL